MKSKVLLPLLSAGVMLCSFTACSDDSSSPAASENSVITSSDANAPVADPTSSASVDPAADPTANTNTDPVADPTTDPVVDPATDPAVDPANPNPDPSVIPSTDPSADAPALEPYRLTIENTFPDNVSEGELDTANYSYYGAELSGKDQFKYGRFEARMKMVSIPGSVSSMFLYYDNSWELGEEPWNEIDIEVLGTNPGAWQANLITRESDVEGMAKKKKKTSETKTGFGFNSTEDFHLYAMIWTPEYISWEIDSVEVRRDVAGMTKKQVDFMTMEQSLRFNLWSSNSVNWVGKFTGAELADGPVEQLIDYVRVYSYDTATKTFTEAWTDDFEGTSLNTSRWARGNWKMENVMLKADNVVVEDGYCKLLMTREAKSADTAE